MNPTKVVVVTLPCPDVSPGYALAAVNLVSHLVNERGVEVDEYVRQEGEVDEPVDDEERQSARI